MEAKQVLEAMSDYLQTNNIFKDMIKEGVWAVVKFLKYFIDALEGAIDAMYSTLTLSVKDVMAEHMTNVGIIAIAVLGVAICVLGYKFMFKRESNKSNSFTGVLLVLVVCMGLPMIFEAGLGLFDSANGNKDMKPKFTEQIIQINVVDLAESINEVDFGVTGTTFEPKKINSETISNLKYVDITESLNKKSKKHFEGSNVATNSKILDKELYYGKGGVIKDVDFDGNKIIQKDGYYRYQANWFAIICSFIIVTVTLVLMSIKVAKILFQMVLDRIVGTILIFSDLEEGKRAKEMLNHILTTFTMLLVSVVSMDIYIGLVGTFSTNIQGEGGLTKSIAQTLVLLGTSLALLEGSQVIEKLMGTRVDSGLTRTGAGLYGVAKMGQTVGNGVKGLGKTAMGVGGAVVGKPAKYAADKTGLTDKVNSGLDKGREMVGGVQNKVDKGLEKVGEKVGLRESSSDSSERNPMDTKTEQNTPKNAGFKNQEPINTGKGQGDSIDTGFKAQEPINTGTNQGSPIDTGFKDEESPLNTGFSSKEPKNNTGALGNQGNSTNTGFSTNQEDLGELSNSDSSSSYASRNESLGTPGANDNSNNNSNSNNSNIDFNDALRNHQAKGGSKGNRKSPTENKRNRGKYQL